MRKNFVAIGDSTVYGDGDLLGGWVNRLRVNTKKNDYVFYNLGIRGDGVRNVLNRVGEIKLRGTPHKEEAKREKPDLILLSVGLNDSSIIAKNRSPFTTEIIYTSKLSELLNACLEIAPTLFIGMHPMALEEVNYQNQLLFNLDRKAKFAQLTKDTCINNGVPYLDIFQHWKTENTGHGTWIDDRISEDDLHPNAQGYKTISEQILNWEEYQKHDQRHLSNTL